MDDRYGWRESQENLCYQRDMMRMMMRYTMVTIHAMMPGEIELLLQHKDKPPSLFSKLRQHHDNFEFGWSFCRTFYYIYIYIYIYICNEWPINAWIWHKAFFKWVQAQGRCTDTPGRHKNVSGLVGIPLEGHLRNQVINLAPPMWVRGRKTDLWSSTEYCKPQPSPAKTANLKTAGQTRKCFESIRL